MVIVSATLAPEGIGTPLNTPTPLGRILAALPGHGAHLRRAWTAAIIVIAATAFVLSMIWVRNVSGSGPRALMVQPAASPQPVYVAADPSPPVPFISPSATLAVGAPAPRRSTSKAPAKRKAPPVRVAGAATAPAKPTVTATYRVGATWDRGFIAALQVRNTAKTPQTFKIMIRFNNQSGVRIGPVWNAVTGHNGDATVLTGGPLAPGATLNVGFQASVAGRARNRTPACTVNGSPCTMS